MNNVDPSGEFALAAIGLTGAAKGVAILASAVLGVFVASKVSDAIADIKPPKLSFGRSRQRESAKEKAQEHADEKEDNSNPSPPDVTYPGDDPTMAPDGTEWKGKGKPGSKNGNYFNPNTKESFHPDLDHPNPIGPHWDYKDPFGNWWRLFKDKMPNMKIK